MNDRGESRDIRVASQSHCRNRILSIHISDINNKLSWTR